MSVRGSTIGSDLTFASDAVGFSALDNFESASIGVLNNQNGWNATSGVTVVVDPLDAGNQALRMNGTEQNTYKPLPSLIASGSTGTLFMRMMRDGAADGFGGLSDEPAPSTWDGYETQFGATDGTPSNFRVRDGTQFVSLDSQFDPDTWYCIWMTVNNGTNQYEIYAQGGVYADRTQLSLNGQDTFNFRNSRGNTLSTFLARMGNPTSSSIYLDDIYVEPDGTNFAMPIGTCAEQAGFEHVETFDNLNVGALEGQNDWNATGGINVVDDPLNDTNKVLQMSGSEQNAYKTLPISISNTSTGTLYMRMMHDGAADGFGGLSDEIAPSDWDDFETYVGATNRDPNRFRVIDGGEGKTLDSQFEPNVWYCVWMSVNNTLDQHKIYVKGGAYASRIQLSAGVQDTYSFRNGTMDPLTTFQARMGTSTTSSMYIDDIYVHADSENFTTPNGTCEYIAPQSEDNQSSITGTNTEPVVDDLVDDIWSYTTENKIDNLVFGTSPNSTNDLSATWHGLFDNNNLYLLIEVTDDILLNDSGSSYWQDDGIEIYLDGNNSGESTYDGVDDLQLRLRWNDENIRVSSPSISLPSGIRHSIVDTATGYRAELSIPLGGINITPSAEYQFGIDVHINDDDDGGGQDHKFAWNSVVDETYLNPSLMGTAQLGQIPICFNLSIAQTGDGSIPAAQPNKSIGCVPGQYVAGEVITLLATLDEGWSISGWNGTSDDTSTLTTNAVTMPNGNHDVSVIYVPPPNNAPIAIEDFITVEQDSANNNIAVLSNDSDLDNDILTIMSATIPSDDGTAIINGTTIIYTPAAGFFGVATFMYTISDGSATDTATVSVTVTATPNTNPIAMDDTASIEQDTVLAGLSVLTNDTDVDGDPLTVELLPIEDVTNGALLLYADGTYVYTPNTDYIGTDSFMYEVHDGNGGTGRAVVQITVTKRPNKLPVAGDDSISTDENTTLIGTTLLANDFDEDDDSLIMITTPVTPPINGMLTLNSDGTFVYSPNQDFDGSDIFVYKIDDGNGGADTATVSITVNNVNRPPEIGHSMSSVKTLSENGILTGSLLDSIVDPDGDTLVVNTIPQSDAVHGELTINADGTYSYTPDQKYSGEDSFAYQVTDGQGGVIVITISVKVEPINRSLYLPMVTRSEPQIPDPEPTSVTVEKQVIADTFIKSGEADQGDANYHSVLVGHNNLNTLEKHSLLRFDLVDIEINSQITGAQLVLTIGGFTKNDRDINITVSRLIGQWSESITWDQYSEAINNATLFEDISGAESQPVRAIAGTVTWDVTKMVQTEVSDNVITDISFLLQSNEKTGEHERAFWSKDCQDEDIEAPCGAAARLIITYTQ